MDPTIFKAYDIRGTYPDQIDEELAYQIGQAYAQLFTPKTIAVGYDVRLSSPALEEAVVRGLVDSGVEVWRIGLGPTEMIYYAVGHYQLDGGIQVTASHNPAQYAGFKLVKKGVEGVSNQNGINEIRDLVQANQFTKHDGGKSVDKQLEAEYISYLAERFHISTDRPLKIVANNNFGVSGLLAKKVLDKMGASNIELVGLNFTPDGSFPKGRPDPLVRENRAETTALIQESKADMGVAWDADGDRCYVADETGLWVEGCHLTAFLGAQILTKHPKSKIIYERRNVYAVQETIREAGGEPILSQTGHTFIKNTMRQNDAVFGGEMSGHYYYKDFYYADNGLITFFTVLERFAPSGGKMSELFADLRDKYHVSGEQNFKVADVNAVLSQIEAKYQGQVDKADGLSVDMGDWRFNLRPSNTEPLLRLNVESKNADLLKQKTAELVAQLQA